MCKGPAGTAGGEADGGWPTVAQATARRSTGTRDFIRSSLQEQSWWLGAVWRFASSARPLSSPPHRSREFGGGAASEGWLFTRTYVQLDKQWKVVAYRA